MDKLFAKLLTEALAPFVALLTEIRDQRTSNPVAALALPAPAALPPLVEKQHDPEIAKLAVGAIEVKLPPIVIPIPREALGKALTEVAKIDMEKAFSLIKSFTNAGVVCSTLNDVHPNDYPKLAELITATQKELDKPKTAAGLL